MKITKEDPQSGEQVLTIEAEPGEMERSLDKAYRKLAPKLMVPGFRKGKAPRMVVERYLGRVALVEEAVDDLVPQLYRQALESEKVEAAADPDLEVTQLDPLLFKARVPLRPVVEPGDYHQLKAAPVPVEVPEGLVRAAIDRLRFNQAPWEPVADRPAHFSDLLVLAIEGRVDGKVYLRDDALQYQMVAGSSYLVPGFAEKLEGMDLGEERELTFPFPIDHPSPELAGRTFDFRAEVSEIKERRLPPLDDEFARSLGQGFESVEELRQRVIAELKARAEEDARRRLEGEVVAALVQQSRMEYSPILVDREVGRLLEEEKERLSQSRIKWEDHLKRIGKTESQLREELRPAAIQRLQQSLVLEEVARQEGIQVSPEEVEAEVQRLTRETREKVLQSLFASPAGRRGVERVLRTRKTLERLVSIATENAARAAEVPPEITRAGILLPGREEKASAPQEAEERTEGGVILPKGYKSRSSEKSVKEEGN